MSVAIPNYLPCCGSSHVTGKQRGETPDIKTFIFFSVINEVNKLNTVD